MQPNSVVLLIGETGSGKSTFINYLANFFLRGSPTAPKIAIPNKNYPRPNIAGYTSAEANLTDPTSSQTTKCSTYAFRRNRRKYAFIDTPGLSDTRSVEQDDHNIEEILRAASQPKSLRAIFLIINGSTVRNTLNVKNALERMAGILPNTLLSNLIVIYTNCAQAGQNFNESNLPSRPAKSVAMNNSAFSSPPANWDGEDLKVVKFDWARSMKKIKEVLNFIHKLVPQSTQAFAMMLDSRERIRMEIDEAVQQIIEQQRIYQQLKGVEMKEKQLADICKSQNLEYQTIETALRSTGSHLRKLQSRSESHEQRIAEYTQRKHQLKSNRAQDPSSFFQAVRNQRGNPLAIQRMVDDFNRKRDRYATDLEDINAKLKSERQRLQLTQNEEENMRYEEQRMLSKQRNISANFAKVRQTMKELQENNTQFHKEIKETKERIQRNMDTVQQDCRELKTVCSNFNFAQELKSKKFRLQMHKSTLRDDQAIQDAQALLYQLDQLAAELMSV